MKKTLTVFSVIGLLSAASNATTITASGGTGGAQFITSQGTFLTPSNAFVLVGLWNGVTFTQFALADATPINFGTTAALEGRWLGNYSDNSASANPFNGQQIWFQITTTADGGGTAYLSGGQLFPANGGGVGDSLSIPGSSLNTLGAGSTAGSAVYNAGTNRVTIGVIPEPSVALLGAFGVLGLLRRRR